MISEKIEKLIKDIPKAENHVHLEGSIPGELAIKIANRNGIDYPFSTGDEINEYIRENVVDLDTFMEADRLIISALHKEEDFADLVLELAKNAKKQNIIYLELMTSPTLSEDRGIPLEVIINGYDKGRRKAKELYDVEIEFIANIDRTISSERSLRFVEELEKYKSKIAAIGLDCEEQGHAGNKHQAAFELAGELGFYRTAHA
jgi:adenosine deaminase